MEQNGKKRQIKPAPNLIFFLLHQIKSAQNFPQIRYLILSDITDKHNSTPDEILLVV